MGWAWRMGGGCLGDDVQELAVLVDINWMLQCCGGELEGIFKEVGIVNPGAEYEHCHDASWRSGMVG